MNEDLLPYALYAGKKLRNRPDWTMANYHCLNFDPHKTHSDFAWLTKAVFEHEQFTGFHELDTLNGQNTWKYMLLTKKGEQIRIPADDLATFLLKALPCLDGVTIDEP